MSANVQEEERPSVSETPMPRYTLQLEPPIGTCFWSVQDIPIFTKKIVQSKESDQHILITWSCQCYISTTNQTPDSGNFAESGGAFYVVMKHSGHDTSDPYYEHVMQMFTSAADGEVNSFTHVAKYNETFRLLKMDQSGRVIDNAAGAIFRADTGSKVEYTQGYSWPVRLQAESTFRVAHQILYIGH
ncbi:hypothetical protein BDN71DRAFT_1429898 [Pleurotus eryngii]|uniref:Uncharacterized protein n=1 Tax=Pleurotus eryngii TaxID=5323 RepID=A0A9P6D9Y9_PLEER|nr:hypothetical protein BDN71DRAFT_1429898 [Pleurotus eryngii]